MTLGPPWQAIVDTERPYPRLLDQSSLLHGSSRPETLLYIGQGLVAARLSAHLAKGLSVQHRQAQVFAQSQVIQASWVLSDTWYPHERLELETDLIGAHLLATGVVPPGQFLG